MLCCTTKVCEALVVLTADGVAYSHRNATSDGSKWGIKLQLPKHTAFGIDVRQTVVALPYRSVIAV